jgi:ABC-type Na+ efflux pump permease subunit
MLRSEPPKLEGTIAVIDASGHLVAALERGLQAGGAPPEHGRDDPFGGEIKAEVRFDRVPDPAREQALREDLAADRLAALVLVQPSTADGAPAVELLVPSSSRPLHTRWLERQVHQAVVRTRVEQAGQDYDRVLTLLDVPRVRASRLSPGGVQAKDMSELRMMVPVGFMLLLWIAVFTSAQYLLTSTIEEKSSRVMEVLLSAVSPAELLGGKLLGQSLVSAVVLVMYGGLAVAGLGALAMMDVVKLSHLLWIAAWFPLAYLMVAAIMAGVGSAVNDLHEAQSLLAPAMVAMVLPLILWLPISHNPNGAVAVAFSFIPPASPFVNVMRITTSSEPVPLWESLLALAVAAGCVLALVWAGSRVFRVGVLMQGKTPSPRELLRWIRAR